MNSDTVNISPKPRASVLFFFFFFLFETHIHKLLAKVKVGSGFHMVKGNFETRERGICEPLVAQTTK